MWCLMLSVLCIFLCSFPHGLLYSRLCALQGWATVLAVGVGLNTLFELLNQEFLERVRIEEEELAKASGSSHSPALGKHAHGASGILSQNGSSSSPQSKVKSVSPLLLVFPPDSILSCCILCKA